MKRAFLIFLAAASVASAQTFLTVTADTNRVVRTNFSLVRSQISDLSGASFAIGNITGLQTALDGKLATNGSAAALTNFPASLLTTNGSAGGLTNFPASLLVTNGNASGLTNFPALLLTTNSAESAFPVALLRTNGNAAALTNFPALLLTTNSAQSAFPAALLRTNGDGSGLTNLPNANLSNAIGVLPISNGGTGSTNASNARTALGLGTAATNDAAAFQTANTNLTALAGGDGSSLTNVTITDASTLTNFPAELLRTNGNAAGLTNFPSELLRTNGDGSGLTGVASYPAFSNNAGKVLVVATNEAGVEWLPVSNTVTDASLLTNFPASLLTTNGNAAALTNFPAELLRTNGSAAALTGFPTLNQNTTGTASNVTGIVAIANGGTAASNAINARINLLPTYTGNEGRILAVNSNATDLVWAVDGGGTANLTNVTNTLAVANGGSGATNGATALTNFGVLTAANGVQLLGTSVSGANVAIGLSSSADDGTGLGGVALGRGAVASNSAIAIGYNARNAADYGVAIGYQATNTGTGASIGYQANSDDGGAMGRLASSINGFAGGRVAKATATNSSQIGTGTNSTDNTIQFLSAGTIDTNEWARIAALSTYPTTNISVVGTNNTNTLVFSNGILVEVQ
jgi:hypothetical protein